MRGLEELLRAVFDGTETEVYAIDEDGIRRINTPRNPEYVIDGDWRLFLKGTQVPIELGMIVESRDETYRITGGRAPRHEASSGRVYVESMADPASTREFFPHVFDLEWRANQ